MSKSPKYEIEKTLVLSTRHITLKDSRLLGSYGLGNTIVDEYPYGWWIHVSDDRVSRVAVRRDGFSRAFRDLIELAHVKRCGRLRLDQDGPVMDGLATFNW